MFNAPSQQAYHFNITNLLLNNLFIINSINAKITIMVASAIVGGFIEVLAYLLAILPYYLPRLGLTTRNH